MALAPNLGDQLMPPIHLKFNITSEILSTAKHIPWGTILTIGEATATAVILAAAAVAFLLVRQLRR